MGKHKIFDGGIVFLGMFPMDRPLTIHNGESEECVAMKVFSIHRELTRERDRRCGPRQGIQSEGKEGDKDGSFHDGSNKKRVAN